MHWQDLVSVFPATVSVGFIWGVMYMTANCSLLKICFSRTAVSPF